MTDILLIPYVVGLVLTAAFAGYHGDERSLVRTDTYVGILLWPITLVMVVASIVKDWSER